MDANAAATQCIERMMDYLHITNAQFIKSRFSKQGLTCNMSDLRLLFPPPSVYTSGLMRDEVEGDSLITISRKTKRFVHDIISNEKNERRHADGCSLWRVPSGRHWPLLGSPLSQLSEESFWSKEKRICLLCGTGSIIAGGSEMWKLHCDSSDHISNLATWKRRNDEERKASAAMGKIFHYFTSLGAPLEFARLGKCQYIRLSNAIATLIYKKSLSIISIEELEVVLYIIYDSLAQSDDSYTGTFIVYDTFKDALEILLRFLFQLSTKLSSISSNTQGGETPKGKSTEYLSASVPYQSMKCSIVSMLIEYLPYRIIDITSSYIRNDVSKKALLSHQYALRSIFQAFATTSASLKGGTLSFDEAVKALHINASDSEALKLDSESFLSFCTSFNITKVKCDEDTLRRVYKQSLAVGKSALTPWQFVEVIGKLSLFCFPPSDIKIRSQFFQSNVSYFLTPPEITGSGNAIAEIFIDNSNSFSATKAMIQTVVDAPRNRDVAEGILTVDCSPVKTTNSSESFINTTSWSPIQQRLRKEKPVHGGEIVHTLPQALLLGKKRGEVWLHRMSETLSTTTLAPDHAHIVLGEDMLLKSRYKLVNRPQDNSHAIVFENKCIARGKEIEKRRQQLVMQRRGVAREKLKLRSVARNILQDLSGQSGNIKSIMSTYKNSVEVVNTLDNNEGSLEDDFDKSFHLPSFPMASLELPPDTADSQSTFNTSKASAGTSMTAPSLLNTPVEQPVAPSSSKKKDITDLPKAEEFLDRAVSIDLEIDENSQFFRTTRINSKVGREDIDRNLSSQISWTAELGTISRNETPVEINTKNLF